MAILIDCDCGRSVRVKDALAGRKIRCPACKDILTVPAEEIQELEVVEDDSPTAITTAPKKKSPRPRPRDEDDDEDGSFTTEAIATKKAPLPKGHKELDGEARHRTKKRLAKRRPRATERDSRARQTALGDLAAIGTGLLMMLGAVIWFIGGLYVGYIFFYPPILFILGIAAICKGALGRE